MRWEDQFHCHICKTLVYSQQMANMALQKVWVWYIRLFFVKDPPPNNQQILQEVTSLNQEIIWYTTS